MSLRIVRWVFWPTAVVLVLGTTYFLWHNAQPRRTGSAVHASPKKINDPASSDEDPDSPPPPEAFNVKATKPRRGAMERITVQVGSVEADEVLLYSMVTGILKKQPVLIGDRVKKGDLLAEIDVPDLKKQVDRNRAVVEQAKARVQQMDAKVVVAQADLEAANADVVYAEANARAAGAMLLFRTMYHNRMKGLFQTNSIEEKVLDESKERHEAAREAENAAKAAIVTNKAKASSVAAKIKLAEADVEEARAQVKIAQADLEKSEVLLSFARITAPFNGIITQRSLYEGATVRSVTDRGGQSPLLTIQRTDVVRVVVQVPDAAARYADKGDAAYVEIDAFPGQKFTSEVSRVAEAEDPQTRLMRVEIDLNNPKGEIRQGMFGRVTIILDKATDQFSIPSSCLIGRTETGKGYVYVEREGKVHRTKVRLGMFNDVRVEVLQGLTANDRVILAPPHALRDGAEVHVDLIDETAPKLDNDP